MRDQELLQMHEALFGVALVPEPDPGRLLERLRAGESNLAVTLRWTPNQPLQTLMLTHLGEDGRVHFFRPQAMGASSLGAPETLSHEEGDESVSQAELASWFRLRDGLGYVSA